MEIELTPEQASFVQLGVEQGRFRHAEDAVKDALALWERRERARIELLTAIDDGDASFAEGAIEFENDEELAAYFEGIKSQGAAKLANA
jgi:putative addiction module CopG family antidote